MIGIIPSMNRRTLQILVSGIFAIILALAFTACDDLLSLINPDNISEPDDQKGSDAPNKDLPESKPGNTLPVYRNIVWNLNGGTADSEEYTTQIVKGGKLNEPANNPAKYYSQFIGWYRDSELKYAYTFTNSRVNDDLTLYAKWEAVGVTIDPPKEGSWKQWAPSYNKSYNYLMEKNYNGTIFYASGAVFSATVKDADDQTVIWKIEGENGEKLDDDTTIDDSGTLFVAANDHGKKVIITAVSGDDDGKWGSISVIAVQWLPSDFSSMGNYWWNGAGYSLQFRSNTDEEDFGDFSIFFDDNNDGYIHHIWLYLRPAMNRNNDYADEYITGYTVHPTYSSCAFYSYSRIGFLAISEDKQTLYLGEDASSFYNFDNDDYIPIFYKAPL
jgi:uncharacterized repeat protein (TIGR02543 family)